MTPCVSLFDLSSTTPPAATTRPQAGTVTIPRPEELTEPKTRLAPRWHVVLLDDDEHTYDYVIEMLMRLFQHSLETAFQMAVEVDNNGCVIVDTTSRERAELKREQIHAFGADWRIPACQGSMSAVLEPAED